ncbi:hypothetical protein DKG71_34590 [Streptomyces sp. NEAU-S7GS2]|nr:hypothetical protein DKG71_34590 [Streptomyces sp. NEAU-S7GS2]
MPSHPVAVDLRAKTGAMAVSSANPTGAPSPQGCGAAQGVLDDSVAVYLGDGPTSFGGSSRSGELKPPGRDRPPWRRRSALLASRAVRRRGRHGSLPMRNL